MDMAEVRAAVQKAALMFSPPVAPSAQTQTGSEPCSVLTGREGRNLRQSHFSPPDWL